MTDYIERNRKIAIDVLVNNKTFSEVARYEGIDASRARQIVHNKCRHFKPGLYKSYIVEHQKTPPIGWLRDNKEHFIPKQYMPSVAKNTEGRKTDLPEKHTGFRSGSTISRVVMLMIKPWRTSLDRDDRMAWWRTFDLMSGVLIGLIAMQAPLDDIDDVEFLRDIAYQHARDVLI